MAAEERARADFGAILSKIGRKFEFMSIKWHENKNFEVKFRTQIEPDVEDHNALCDEWVDLFSETTNTVWAKKISNTGPKIRFRKQYQNWTHGGKIVQKELLFDARRCKGTLDIKVLTDNQFTRRKNKHIRLGLNVVVKINFNHLHEVNFEEDCAFFVHLCEPQAEAPKPQIAPNDRLPQLVAEMVQKGHNSTRKPKLEQKSIASRSELCDLYEGAALLNDLDPKMDELSQTEAVLPYEALDLNLPTIQVLQNVPMQAVEGIKLELTNQFQQFAVVGSNLNEPLLMCQSLVFDTNTQVLGLQPQLVHLQNLENQ